MAVDLMAVESDFLLDHFFNGAADPNQPMKVRKDEYWLDPAKFDVQDGKLVMGQPMRDAVDERLEQIRSKTEPESDETRPVTGCAAKFNPYKGKPGVGPSLSAIYVKMGLRFNSKDCRHPRPQLRNGSKRSNIDVYSLNRYGFRRHSRNSGVSS